MRRLALLLVCVPALAGPAFAGSMANRLKAAAIVQKRYLANEAPSKVLGMKLDKDGNALAGRDVGARRRSLLLNFHDDRISASDAAKLTPEQHELLKDATRITITAAQAVKSAGHAAAFKSTQAQNRGDRREEAERAEKAKADADKTKQERAQAKENLARWAREHRAKADRVMTAALALDLDLKKSVSIDRYFALDAARAAVYKHMPGAGIESLEPHERAALASLDAAIATYKSKIETSFTDAATRLAAAEQALSAGDWQGHAERAKVVTGGLPYGWEKTANGQNLQLRLARLQAQANNVGAESFFPHVEKLERAYADFPKGSRPTIGAVNDLEILNEQTVRAIGGAPAGPRNAQLVERYRAANAAIWKLKSTEGIGRVNTMLEVLHRSGGPELGSDDDVRAAMPSDWEAWPQVKSAVETAIAQRDKNLARLDLVAIKRGNRALADKLTPEMEARIQRARRAAGKW